MGGAVSTGNDNDDLVDNLLDADYIKTPLVEKVFRAVDRAHYYIPDQRELAYKDLAWKHERLHMSAPCIYSEVMEALQLEPGLSFLNLGSGTGYLSTMVGLILGPYGMNHGVEQHADVVEYAQERLGEFKCNNTAFDEFDFCEPKFIVGNCLQLNSGCQLYDRVYVGAGCPPEHENYMKNLLKIGGVLVMPLNDRLIQAKRISETEWDITNKLPVSFATLVTPSNDAPQELIDLPEPEQPTLQELCRTTVRRVLRTNIYKTHPDIGKVRKRPKKPKKKSRGTFGSNMNIVPLSMGMMILHQLDREDSLSESENEDDRDVREIDDNDNMDDENGINEDSNDGIDGKFSTDDDENDTKACDVDNDSVIDKSDANVNSNSKCSSDISKSEVASGSQQVSKEKVSIEDDGKEDVVSDYGSDEDDKCDNAIESVAEVNAVLSRAERRTRETAIDEIIANVMGPYSTRSGADGIDDINPPEAPIWSDTDDEEEDKRKYNVEEFIRSEVKEQSLEPPRKARYSSNTSVDTSTTSGIGSFVDDHLDEEMGRSDSAKTSPGWSHSEPEPSSSKSGIQTMDIDDNDVIEGTNNKKDDCQEEEEDDFSKLTLSQCMKEAIESLPLPSAMKMYLKYYRE
ncbi:Protein-L-isoaspartate O-methyltransferase domain-containing protein 1 [Mactra antiquata]